MTATYRLPYGKTSLCLELPPERVLGCLHTGLAAPLAEDEPGLRRHVLAALRQPIGAPPLAQIVDAGDRVVVIANDQTRLARTELFLPLILDELNEAGVCDGDVTVLFALGAHRPLSPDEMIGLVGAEAAHRVRLVNHDCRDGDRLAHVGRTKRGNEVFVNQLLLDADRVILTGSIVYHFFAGFGGGRKAVVPGCAALSTIQHNHAMMLDPNAVIGRLDGNPVHEDLLEAAKLIRMDFLLNVVLNEYHQVVGLFAGDVEAAHRAGCSFVDALYGVPIERRADLVVASCGGWPKDINVYQAQKTMDNAIQAVREGGVVILLAQCPEGAGNDTYLEWMRRYRTPQAIAHATRTSFQLGGHKAYAVTRLLAHAEIVMVSDMPADDVGELLLTPASSLPEALRLAEERLGPKPSVIVMPQGSLTLPRARRGEDWLT